MKRLTSDNVFEMNMTALALNQVFVRDGWTWYRKGPEDECSVCDLIRSVAAKGLDLENIELDPNLTDEELGGVMLDWLQFGEEEPEGVLAILYRALWAMAEVRAGLKNDPLTLEELREMDGKPVYIKRIGSDHPAYGITASGAPVEEGVTCAVDRSVIPLFSTVYVEYADGTVEQFQATDTGVKAEADLQTAEN